MGPVRRDSIDFVRLATPLGLGNLVIISLTVIDFVMVGRLGSGPLATATVAINVLLLVKVLGEGIPFSVLPHVSKASERRDGDAIVSQIATLSTMSVLYTLLAAPLFFAGADLFSFLGQPPELIGPASDLLQILWLALLPNLLFLTVIKVAAAIKRTDIVLISCAIALLGKVLCNWFFLFHPAGSIGLSGLAISAVASFGLAVVWGMRAIFIAIQPIRTTSSSLDAKTIIRDMVRAIPDATSLGLIELSTVGSFFASAYLMGTFGPLAIAASTVAFQVTEIGILFILGFGDAAAVNVSRGVATGRKTDARRQAVVAIATGIAIAGGLGAMLWLARGYLPLIFFDVSELSEEAFNLTDRLLVIGIVVFVVDAVDIVLRGVLRGVNITKLPLLFSIIGYWGIGFGLAIFVAIPLGYSVEGIWFAMGLGRIAAAVLVAILALWYWRVGTWSDPPRIAATVSAAE